MVLPFMEESKSHGFLSQWSRHDPISSFLKMPNRLWSFMQVEQYLLANHLSLTVGLMVSAILLFSSL